MNESERHRPVMVREALEFLKVEPGGTYIDATVGAGGHAEQILKTLGEGSGRLLGIDRDPAALRIAQERLASFGGRVKLVQGNFAEIDALCAGSLLPAAAGVLADLGLSSMQLEDAARGFSFSQPGPLDMRMGAGELTAEEIVNQTPERELADLIFKFGEERHSRRIARAIVKARPIRLTTQLAQVVTRAIPSRAGLHQKKSRSRISNFRRIHPATRTFLALRLVVNRELESLERFLEKVPGVLAPGARVVMISFHSLEDRIVKESFRRWQREGKARILTKHVVRPEAEETEENPRSRSAKLRAAEKL